MRIRKRKGRRLKEMMARMWMIDKKEVLPEVKSDSVKISKVEEAKEKERKRQKIH
jgi:hypothetical protein